ncbi:MAG: hypothetical protein H7039_00795 [Bryobacteraceae bacterium]|nr:hypothetical protein [Bryobacteraceae bacterium]
MTRRSVIGAAFSLAACSPTRRTFDQVLPLQLEGTTWRRGDLKLGPAIPEQVQQLGVVDASEATYLGQGSVRVRVFRMKAETSAFELMQKWRQVDGLAAYKGQYFFVAEGSGTSRDAVLEVLSALQRLNSVA